MTDQHDFDSQMLPDEAAHRLLARAAQLDAAGPQGLSVARLRQAALDAGISPTAFDTALRMEAEGLPDAPQPPGAPTPPWWVRGCMFGVPDRRTAIGYYWLFVAAFCGIPLALRQWEASWPVTMAATLGAAAFTLFASWSTSRAIRWLDRHGWDTLR